MILERQIWDVFLKIGGLIDRVRSRHGRAVASLLVASVLLLLAMIYVRPALPFFPSNLVGVTEEHYAIAADPFGYNWEAGSRGFRIAVPMLSYLIGLPGEKMAYTNLILIFLFIFCLFYKYYRNQESALVALSIASAFAFSAAILYNLFDLAGVEATRIMLAVLMIFTAQKRILFWVLFLICIFTHEGSALFLPFFLLLRWPHRKNVVEFLLLDVVPAVAIVGLYMYFFQNTGNARYLSPWVEGIGSFLTATQLNLRKWAWFGYDGFFSGLKLFWLIILIALVQAIHARRYYQTLLLLAPIGGFLAMMVISWEATRFALLASPSLIIAFDQLRETYGDEKVAKSLLLLGVINLFVPQQISLGGAAGTMPSLPHMLIFWIF